MLGFNFKNQSKFLIRVIGSELVEKVISICTLIRLSLVWFHSYFEEIFKIGYLLFMRYSTVA